MEKVRAAVKTLESEPSIPLNRNSDGWLRFMSEAIQEVAIIRDGINISGIDLSRELSDRVRSLFTPLPNVRLAGARKVQSGIKLMGGRGALSIDGEREGIQTVIELVEPANYDRRRDELLTESGQPSRKNDIFWIARKGSVIDRLLREIKKSEAIHGQYRSRAVEKEVSQYLDSQLKQAETMRRELEEELRSALYHGSFIFRSDPTAVSALDPAIDKAIERQLGDVAAKVFAKYPLAPHQADTALAKKFLEAKSLDRAAEQFDPLKVIKKEGGTLVIDTNHPALVALCDYLGEHGRKDGKSLLDDLFEPEFGWSKDTSRYLLAVLFKAGKIQLRIGGDDISVVGEQALASFQNSNSFARVGVSLRDTPPDPEAVFRAVDRLVHLTGNNVDPLEDEISRAVLRYFPAYLDDFSTLAVQLGSADLPGADRADHLMEGLRQIMAADASSATPVLGAESCDLYDDIAWAKKLRKAFKEGLLDTVRELRRHLREIEALPGAGAAGTLANDTAEVRTELASKLGDDAFFEHQPALQSGLSALKTAVDTCCIALTAELADQVDRGAETLQAMPEWSRLNEEHRETLFRRIESLKPTGQQGLAGLRTLLNQPYAISSGLEAVRREILRLAKEEEDLPPKDDESPERDEEKEDSTEETVTLPAEIGSEADLENLIDALRRLGDKLKRFKRIRLQWRSGDPDSGDA